MLAECICICRACTAKMPNFTEFFYWNGCKPFHRPIAYFPHGQLHWQWKWWNCNSCNSKNPLPDWEAVGAGASGDNTFDFRFSAISLSPVNTMAGVHCQKWPGKLQQEWVASNFSHSKLWHTGFWFESQLIGALKLLLGIKTRYQNYALRLCCCSWPQFVNGILKPAL